MHTLTLNTNTLIKVIFDLLFVAPLTIWGVLENLGTVKSTILFALGVVFLLYRIIDTRESARLKKAQRENIRRRREKNG